MKNDFSYFKLITDTNIYKIRVIIFKKTLFTNVNFKNYVKNLEKRYLLTYTKIVENAA